MDFTRKFDYYAPRIVGGILGLLVGAAVNKILGIQGICSVPGIGWSIDCFWINWIILVSCIVLGYVVVHVILHGGLPSIQKVSVPNPRNIEIKKGIDLKSIIICNKEWRKSNVFISSVRIFVANETIPESAIEEIFSLKQRACKTIPFIRFDGKHNQFVIAKPYDELVIRPIKPGKSKFDIDLLYGYSVNHIDRIKRFSVTVSCDLENGARIETIEHAD